MTCDCYYSATLHRVASKCDACRVFLSLFRNKFNKVNNTRAQMLDYNCHIKRYALVKFYVHNVVMDVIMFPDNL